ncbi:MAG: D-lyxose/D-mannose family sugar isomerase [Anaerolineae bacterium]
MPTKDDNDFPFQVTGQHRAEALRKCRETLADWGLTMPPVSPLALDFGLGRFDEVGEIEFWVANEEQAGYCGKFLYVADGQTCPYHKHNVKHETFFVLKGTVRMILDGEEKILQQGEVLVMPPGQRHSFTGIGPALLLEVSMPSQRNDSHFANPQIGENGVI